MTAMINSSFDFSVANNSLRVPGGNTAQRPTVNLSTDIRFNTDLGQYENYNPNSKVWEPFGGGSELVVQNNNVTVNSTNTLDFSNGPNTQLTVTDDFGNNRVNVFIDTRALVVQNNNVRVNTTNTLDISNGANIQMIVTDDHANGRVNVFIDSTASGGGGGSGNYEVDVLANGVTVLANAKANFNNTATVNVAVTANGLTIADIALNANGTALVGPTAAIANTALAVSELAYGEANTALTVAESAYTEANLASSQATSAYGQANTATTIAEAAYSEANTAVSAYNVANAAANSVAVYANASLILAQANINFNNTATVNVAASTGTGQANLAFNVNTTAILITANGALGNTINAAANTVATYANGTLVLADANLNFNNTSTVNVAVTANGTGQSNVAFNANGTAIVGPTAAIANLAYTQANTATTSAASALSVAESAFSEANGAQANALLAYAAANSAANSVAVYANGVLVLSDADLNFNNTATMNVLVQANGTGQANITYSVNTAAVNAAVSGSYLPITGGVLTGTLQLGVSTPIIYFNSTTANANAALWDVYVSNAGAMVFEARNDNQSNINHYLVATRNANTSNIIAVQYGNPQDTALHTLYGNVTVTGNSTLSGNVAIGTTPGTQRLIVNRPSGGVATGEAYFSEGNHWTEFNANSSPGAFNSTVLANDHTIIFSDGTVGTGNLTIGPWSTTAGGLRIDFNGNVGINKTLSNPTVNAAANTVAVYDNDNLIIANANLNFNNTSTVNVAVTAGDNLEANITFTVNTTSVILAANGALGNAINAAGNTVAVYANGNLIASQSDLNFNNSATVTVSVTANGTGQANISFTTSSIQQVNVSNQVLGSQGTYQSTFTYYTVNAVCAIGQVYKMILTTQNNVVSLWDVQVLGSPNGNGSLWLSATDVWTANYTITTPWNYQTDDGTQNFYIALRNRGGKTTTFNLHSLLVTKYA